MTATGDQDCTGEDFTDAVFADQEWEGRCSLLGSTVSDCRLRPWSLREVDLPAALSQAGRTALLLSSGA